MTNTAKIREGEDTFVLLGADLVEVRRDGCTWNNLPGVRDRFAFNEQEGDTFPLAVADYIRDESEAP